MQQNIYYNPSDELDEDLNINLKKFFVIFQNRKEIIITVFLTVLAFFILLTFISTKKWTVNADLYINKANSTNYLDINPYAIEESGGLTSLISSQNPLANELELMQSPLVIDKVIKENNLRFKKLFNIIPTRKTGEYLTTEKFLKKGINIETKKGTNVISISYTNKNKDMAYNVVSSIITNYIALHKELNSEKSKADMALLEEEYNKAKSELEAKISSAKGIPSNSMTGTGTLAAMSAFSNSAQRAMSTLKGQYIAGENSRVEITEDANKVAKLAAKLEWAKLVDEMSDSSKVLVIKEPYPLRDWEYSSPKLFTNILLGIVFGIIFAIIGVIYKEMTDKKLTYSSLGNDIIYDLDMDFETLSAEVIANSDKKTAFVFFEEKTLPAYEKFKDFQNIILVKADITNSFKEYIEKADNVITFASIGKTSNKKYALVKKLIKNLDKKLIFEVLV